MKGYNYTCSSEDAFTKDLKQAIAAYFNSSSLSRKGGSAMVYKTFFMFTLYLVPVVLLYAVADLSVWSVFGLYVICGLGMAGIGMSVMHDALHGSYSSWRWLNNLMGYSINLLGASADVWKLQHNVLHHTYTNIGDMDDDLNTTILLRFSPDKKWIGVHRFQQYYAWLLYGLMSLSWVTTRDFTRIYRYQKMGLVQDKKFVRKVIIKAIWWKIVYFGVTLIGPLIVLNQPFWLIILAFFAMHLVAGFSLSIIFQTAHIMPETSFPVPDAAGNVDESRYSHQLATTCNYSPRSKLFSWLIGGLNYQIEHHLMPDVCHTHYRKLAPIVREVAEKHDIPYYSNTSFWEAMRAHYVMLKQLGSRQLV